MHVYTQCRLTARISLSILAFGALIVFTGCKSTSELNPSSDLQSIESKKSDELENAADTFSEVSEEEFNGLKAGEEAEFLGCLCVSVANDKSKWSASQFLSVGTKGFRTATDKQVYDDLEACVSMRETLMECEG